jgi:hypothetical protein
MEHPVQYAYPPQEPTETSSHPATSKIDIAAKNNPAALDKRELVARHRAIGIPALAAALRYHGSSDG